MAVRRHPAVGPTGATGATGATGPQGTAPAGTPVLRGPYVVDFTDIPHDGDTLTLWTPQVGDVLLHLFPNPRTAVSWDHGLLFIGQNVDGVSVPAHNTFSGQYAPGSIPYALSELDTINAYSTGLALDGSGNPMGSAAYVFATTDPVQIQLAQTGGTDPTTGHVELYSLVARATAP